jgi:hypothetical protein
MKVIQITLILIYTILDVTAQELWSIVWFIHSKIQKVLFEQKQSYILPVNVIFACKNQFFLA